MKFRAKTKISLDKILKETGKFPEIPNFYRNFDSKTRIFRGKFLEILEFFFKMFLNLEEFVKKSKNLSGANPRIRKLRIKIMQTAKNRDSLGDSFDKTKSISAVNIQNFRKLGHQTDPSKCTANRKTITPIQAPGIVVQPTAD